MSLCWTVLSVLQFSTRLMRKHREEIIIIVDVFKIAVKKFFPILQYLKMISSALQEIFMNKQAIFEGRQQISLRSSNGLLTYFENTLALGQWTNRKQQRPQGNSLDLSPINVNSPTCFFLNPVGNVNDDISLVEENFEHSKTSARIYRPSFGANKQTTGVLYDL